MSEAKTLKDNIKEIFDIIDGDIKAYQEQFDEALTYLK